MQVIRRNVSSKEFHRIHPGHCGSADRVLNPTRSSLMNMPQYVSMKHQTDQAGLVAHFCLLSSLRKTGGAFLRHA